MQAIWQFEDDDKNGWVSYQAGHQMQIEQAYQLDPNGFTTIEHFPWTYMIDFGINMQMNLDHPNRTTRKIRRISMNENQNNDKLTERIRFTDNSIRNRRGSHRLSFTGSLIGGFIGKQEPAKQP